MGHFIYVFLLYINGMTLAYDDLSLNKVATQSHIYLGIGYDANNAVDGNTATCMRTKAIGPNNPDKTVWWRVDLGGLRNIYSISVLFKNYNGYDLETRQQGRFAGFSLYVSNTGDIQSSTLCYKDGPQLPPLNFTTICAEYGRYVIYYNERLNGVSYPEDYEIYNDYTELCEVSVTGCTRHGMYGNQCNMSCPANCQDKMCHIVNGTCQRCGAGWTGEFCTRKCAVERYGVECKGICSGHCASSTSCNHVTGQCDRGCAFGWEGSLCNKECDNGTFGYDCVNNCSGHCLNNSPCNKQTGHCDRGCNPGYTNVFCSEICRPEYYGNGCGQLCNGYCMNNRVCSHVDGVCLAGCQDGYIGKYCNNSCKQGYFGKNCSSVCSPHCKTCRHTDGHCSCSAGYTGYRCTTECFQSYGENCHYPCSQHCYDKNCDRFNGSCLTGCTDGFYDKRCDKDIQMLRQYTPSSISWIVGLSISIAANVSLITCICVICRGKYRTKRLVSCNFLYCWKFSEIYQDATATSDEPSTYQELAVTLPKTELPYHNTTLK